MTEKSAYRQTSPYDAAEFLETDEGIVAYLIAALEDGNPMLVSAALDDITRVRCVNSLKLPSCGK
jgi:DNA-binding phage protein